MAKQRFFSLDEPISRYIPVTAINKNLNKAVTIRQLLAHESGYSDYVNEPELQVAVAAQPTRIWTPFEMMTFVHQLSDPGTERRYSSTNYIILGALIELVTGKKVEDLYRKKFFDPLGLGSMYLGVREDKLKRNILASPHDNISAFNPVFELTGQQKFPDTFTNISRFPLTAIVSLAFTGGGIVSNARDLAEWSSALYNGRATGKTVLNTMLQSISDTPDADGDRLGYGIIVSTRISTTETFIGHDGNAPGYRSVMFYQPDKKLTIVILTNFHGADIYAVAKALNEVIPEFLCGNKKEDNIKICFWDKTLCLPRSWATNFIRYGGAYLGSCIKGCSVPFVKIDNQPLTALQLSPDNKSRMGVFPNPFVSSTSFTFTAVESGPARLSLYDINGKFVATIYNGFIQKGTPQQIPFDGSKLPAGIYISRLQMTSGFKEQKVIRLP